MGEQKQVMTAGRINGFASQGHTETAIGSQNFGEVVNRCRAHLHLEILECPLATRVDDLQKRAVLNEWKAFGKE